MCKSACTLKIKALHIILGTALCLSAVIVPQQKACAEDIPGMPMVLYGVVYANGNVIGPGYWVEARINSSTVASCQTNASGQYGYGTSQLAVPGTQGNTISFYINGVQSSTTVAFAAGARNLDIQVSGNIPTSYTPPNPNVTITTTSLPSGAVGTAYSATLTASGGTPPYTWAVVTGGSLPTGLSLNTNTISGTPSAAGSYTFTIKATDAGSKTATMTYSVTISTQAAAPALSVSTSSLPDGIAGANYAASLSATGGAGAYNWSVTSGALPSGLSLSPSGSISGAPTTSGNYSFTVQVNDGGSSTASRTLSIYIAQSTSSSTTTPTSSTPSSSPGASTSSTTGSSGSGPSSTPASSNVAAFSISNMTATPVSSRNGSQYAISVSIANTGKAPGAKVLQLKINNNVEAQEEVVLDPGESRVVTFTVNKTTPGSYKASIDPLSADFTVSETNPSQQASWNTTETIVWGILIGGALLAILLILLIIYKKRQSDYY